MKFICHHFFVKKRLNARQNTTSCFLAHWTYCDQYQHTKVIVFSKYLERFELLRVSHKIHRPTQSRTLPKTHVWFSPWSTQRSLCLLLIWRIQLLWWNAMDAEAIPHLQVACPPPVARLKIRTCKVLARQHLDLAQACLKLRQRSCKAWSQSVLCTSAHTVLYFARF